MSTPAQEIALPNEQYQLPDNLVSANHPMSTLLNSAVYNQLKLVAKHFSESQLIPKHFQMKPHDVFIALHMAHRMGADPIMVLQNLYVVHGTPGWSAKFIIAQANMSRAFRTGIRWRIEKRGEPLTVNRKVKSGWDDQARKATYKEITAMVPNIAVTAYAGDKETNEELSIEVTMDQAIAEGWTDNEKYSSLGELMLRYRAATLLVRLYAPEVLMGVQVVDELEDIHAASAVPTSTIRTISVESLNASLVPEIKPEPEPAAVIESSNAPTENSSPDTTTNEGEKSDTQDHKPEPDAIENLYSDRVIMVQDCESLGQLDYVRGLDVSAFSANQIKLLNATIDKKLKALTSSPKN